MTIINGSTAFPADVLQVDILKRIGDLEITDVTSYQTALDHYAGQEVEVLLLRDGVEVKKQLSLNP